MTASPTISPTSEQLDIQVQTLLIGPAGTPPVGVTPNFRNPPNLNMSLALTLVICETFETLALVMRMYTKLFIIRSTAREDYAITIAWMIQVVELVIIIVTVKHGAGVHIWNIRLESFFRLLYYINLTAILYCPVVFLTKLSILLQYLRIFVPTRKGNMFMFIGVHICIWSCSIYYLLEFFFEIFMCNPREKIWNKLITTGHCFDVNTHFQASGVFNIITDFATLILPIPCIWKLQMPPKKKILMIGIFAAGVFACVASIMRTYYTWLMVSSPDLSYNEFVMALWATTEIAVGTIISCLPVLPRFFRHFGPKISRAFSFRSSSGTTFRFKGSNLNRIDKTEIALAPKRAFAKPNHETSNGEIWSGRPDINYIRLDSYDRTPPKLGSVTEPSRTPGEGSRTKRNDLESGHHGIEVVRTIHLETEVNTAYPEYMHAQQMGW